jgi:hypothetical protein
VAELTIEPIRDKDGPCQLDLIIVLKIFYPTCSCHVLGMLFWYFAWLGYEWGRFWQS